MNVVRPSFPGGLWFPKLTCCFEPRFDALDGSSNEYGLGRLAHFLNGRHALEPEALTAACVAEVGRFSRGVRQDDDRTILVLRRN